jgi:hypothetical protein
LAANIVSHAKSFTYTWYKGFLGHCLSFGAVCQFRDIECIQTPTILLRHDVDFDLDAAKKLSEVEEAVGIRSTYFMLLTSHCYNPASSEGRMILRNLAERGFEVGLHFDPTVYPNHDQDRLAARFQEERCFLDSITGMAVRSVSIHNPTSHKIYPIFPDVVNTYDPRWFGPDRYLSDSLRLWRRDPFEFVEKARVWPIQILTHPLHYSENGNGYVEAMRRIFEGWRDRAHKYALEHNSSYQEEWELEQQKLESSGSRIGPKCVNRT